MGYDQIKRIMFDTLREMYTVDESLPNYEIDSKHLKTVFVDFFYQLY